mmetsp:Transcript_9428/g.18139  ORF Transcript_9428/g.18139 Transcript_9428/m.18139 type:complete len:280 (-) Transcript_9428:1501-2340(-)
MFELLLLISVRALDCSSGCTSTSLGNLVCDEACYNPSCSWDSGDCSASCSTNCLTSQVGDGTCQQACQTNACYQDNGDCATTCEQRGCNVALKGNGVCNSACNNAECGFDGGDCSLLLLTTTKYVSKTYADPDDDVEDENAGLVAGVGKGVFAVIIMMIIGVLLCVFGAATPVWLCCFFTGLLLPIVTFLIVALSPKHRDVEEEDDDRTDSTMAPRFIFLIIVLISSLVAFAKNIDLYFGRTIKARRVDSKFTSQRPLHELIDEAAQPAQLAQPAVINS